MYHTRHLVIVFPLLVLTTGNLADNEESRELIESQIDHVQSPTLEVFMHLPPNFRSLKKSLGIKPDRIKRKSDLLKKIGNAKTIVDVRSYEVAQPERKNIENRRIKRESPKVEENRPILEKPEPEKLVSSPNYAEYDMMPSTDALRGPAYTTFPVKEFDVIDIDDPEDSRRRRNDTMEDGGQRDKRTFLEGGENGETTTALPFWKRKKENPPFVTGRGSSIPKGNTYTPPQHRSAESARESHSLKNLDKTVQSNEITRTNQDNYYASTNRRTYSRQSEPTIPSTPKSVYDTIDYSKRNQDTGRTDFGRSQEDKKETLRDGRINEQYNHRPFQYNYPAPYDRHYYQPPYTYPTEMIGRGVEYYHRTYDPATGRIVYYANMPEHGRTYDYRYMDPIGRNFYVNRPFVYDPYYRNYVPPYDYRFPNFGRPLDYMRTGRSSSQAYSYQYQNNREKFPRDARFNNLYEKDNRLKGELRNKTYIIYDAEENRSQFPRPHGSESNRLAYSQGQNSLPSSQAPFREYPFAPPLDYFPSAPFPYRNQFYPSPGPLWGFNPRSASGSTESRPYNSPEVQLPLTTSNRSLHPPGEVNLSKKS